MREQHPLTVRRFNRWEMPGGILHGEFYRMPRGGFLIRFPGLVDYEISCDDGLVSCYPAPGVDDDTIEHFFHNQIVPLILSQQGKFVFHASAIETSRGSIAFLGLSGRGKSTLAAYFVSKGHRLMTDDALVLEPTEKGFLVLPGHPSMRLWNDSQAILDVIGLKKAEPLCFTRKTKFLMTSGMSHSDSPQTLRAAYVLGGESADVTFSRLSPSEALMEWAQNSFMLDVEDRSVLTDHFRRTSAVAREVRVYRVDYSRNFDNLENVMRAIIAHDREES